MYVLMNARYNFKRNHCAFTAAEYRSFWLIHVGKYIPTFSKREERGTSISKGRLCSDNPDFKIGQKIYTIKYIIEPN